MSSNATELWLQRWQGLAERVNANAAAAKNLSVAARANVGRATRALSEGDLDAALIWAENALVNGADAVMQKDGVRVRGKERSHQARLEYPGLPKTFRGNAALIGRARAQRNVAAYEGGGRASRSEVEAIVAIAGRATTEVEALFH